MMMTFPQVVKMSVNVITNCPSQDYTHATYDTTPGSKTFTK